MGEKGKAINNSQEGAKELDVDSSNDPVAGLYNSTSQSSPLSPCDGSLRFHFPPCTRVLEGTGRLNLILPFRTAQSGTEMKNNRSRRS